MTTDAPMDAPVYAVSDARRLSMRDLLMFFHEHGSLRVSDLHIKVGSPPVYRIDGALDPMQGPPLDKATVQSLVGAMLSPAELDRLARLHSVDSSHLSDRMQFRLNVFHDNDGLAMAIRALEPRPLPLERIGFPNAVWQDIVQRSFGLVLLTGITGSGKSTTVASLLDRIAQTQACRIITLEDPIEYRLSGGRSLISQREVGRNVSSFEQGLRDALREDPDVIFVGEMRDRESARWTLTAAETGHLVFSTLHTRDARGTITRILDMFPANQQDEVANQLSLGLAYVLCQKLVPRADRQGRAVAMEILHNSYAMANLIRTGKIEQIYSMMQTRTRDVSGERMMTMEHALALLAHQGDVDAQEAEVWANHVGEYRSALRHLEG